MIEFSFIVLDKCGMWFGRRLLGRVTLSTPIVKLAAVPYCKNLQCLHYRKCMNVCVLVLVCVLVCVCV